jgi:hypothetical protein
MPRRLSLDDVQSSFEYMVLTPGIILSEHSTLADARRAQTAAIEQGFSEPAIFKRTPAGWLEHSAQK